MKENFDEALKAILHHEGGYVHHKLDPGGMTNLGVTKRVWEEWVGHEVDEKAMRALTPETVGPMYKTKYWDKIKGDDLPTGVDYIVFDAAINSGPGRAAKWLQQTVGAVPDGAIGAGTLAKVAAMEPAAIIKKYQETRLAFMQSLPTWDTFGKGWGRRVAEVRDAALHMA
jgi:lysozyme family protein